MEDTLKQLLIKLLRANASGSKGVDSVVFRAKNHEQLDLIDTLEAKGYVEKKDEKYYVSLPALLEIESESHHAERLLYLCEHLFTVLRQYYLENPGQPISLNDLALKADLPRVSINKALNYMVKAHIFRGYTTDLSEDEASVEASEDVIRLKRFKDAISPIQEETKPHLSGFPWVEQLHHRQIRPPKKRHAPRADFIDQRRIQDLRKICHTRFDLARLIQICEEINSSNRNDNYFALGALLRILIDHIPPLLGYKTFKEVASNYSGKSLKETFYHLENGCRKISDNLLHQSIRKKESLPNFNQVNYSPQVDALLAEIVRKLEEEGA